MIVKATMTYRQQNRIAMRSLIFFGGDGASLFSNVDINDSDYVDIDSESEDQNCTSFPKNTNPMREMLLGGPQPRDATGMTDSEKKPLKTKTGKYGRSGPMQGVGSA